MMIFLVVVLVVLNIATVVLWWKFRNFNRRLIKILKEEAAPVLVNNHPLRYAQLHGRAIMDYDK